MASNTNALVIAYGGSLKGFSQSEANKNFFSKLMFFFEIYSPDNIDPSTRCGYFLFKGIEQAINLFNVDAASLKVELWGDINSLNNKQVLDLKINQVVKIDSYLKKSESHQKLLNSDILFLPLESSKGGQKPLFLPGKLYEYLQVGKPILALVDDSDCKEILIKSGLGIIISPHDANEIARTLVHLIENKNKLNELYKPNWEYINTFSYKNKASQLAKVFDELLD